MKIKSTISSRIVEQKHTHDGYETFIDLGCMTKNGVQHLKLFVFQSSEDLAAGVFKPVVREYVDV